MVHIGVNRTVHRSQQSLFHGKEDSEKKTLRSGQGVHDLTNFHVYE